MVIFVLGVLGFSVSGFMGDGVMVLDWILVLDRVVGDCVCDRGMQTDCKQFSFIVSQY